MPPLVCPRFSCIPPPTAHSRCRFAPDRCALDASKHPARRTPGGASRPPTPTTRPNLRATTRCPLVGELLIALMAFEHRAACAATPKTCRLRRGVSAPSLCAPLPESHAINLTGEHIHGPEARPRSRRRWRRHRHPGEVPVVWDQPLPHPRTDDRRSGAAVHPERQGRRQPRHRHQCQRLCRVPRRGGLGEGRRDHRPVRPQGTRDSRRGAHHLEDPRR